MPPRILAVIPAYNEEARIASVIRKIREVRPGTDVLVVVDGGRDGTEAVARGLGAAVVVHPYNMGCGAALQTGYAWAVKSGYEAAVQIDGDGQHDPCSIPGLLAPILAGEADVAIGSRFLNGASYRAGAVRRAGMLLFGWVAGLLVGRKVTDPTSGYQALSRAAMELVAASSHYPADFPDADVIVMFHRAGLRMAEVPVVMYPGEGRKSMHRGLGPVYYTFKMFLSIFMSALRKEPF